MGGVVAVFEGEGVRWAFSYVILSEAKNLCTESRLMGNFVARPFPFADSGLRLTPLRVTTEKQ